ncbi:MAG TPA: DUF6526 family protein [Acidobacteriaceae bacterium]|nr:DUF6526 family protein [Acidobacteriaceae bacterium]
MKASEQNLKNHARTDPVFHYVLFGIFTLNLIFSIVSFVRAPGWLSGWVIVLSFALILLLFKVRLYPLKVQDRVIRLEERLRLTLLAPEALRPRLSELREDQLVALRFASDDELPRLAAQTLDEHLEPKEIKKRIGVWRPDHFRV